MKIMFLAAEAAPFFKVGGLGDVAGSLPQSLLAHKDVDDVRLVLPLHSPYDLSSYELELICEFSVIHPDGKVDAKVYQHNIDELIVYFIDGEPVANHPSVYTADPANDGNKYVFFSLAALELAKTLKWQPDIVHGNDWHAAPAVYALKIQNDPFFKNTKTIITVHNLPYLGKGAEGALAAFGLPGSTDETLPIWARYMPLPLGLSAADKITAVSSGYADEILTQEYGSGLHEFLGVRKNQLSGILNGLNMDYWDPKTDRQIHNYSTSTLDERIENKKKLQTELGFGINRQIPLISVISRMDHQKGIDLIIRALRSLMDKSWRAVIHGSGDPEIEERVRRLCREFPDRIQAKLNYDDDLPHRIYAGSDMILIPSRYEPCGMTQMIAMRYGCIPIARATGGLRDTIQDYGVDKNTATGFLFETASAKELSARIRKGLGVYGDEEAWRRLQSNGMTQDFSWGDSTEKYVQLYKELITL